MNTKRILFICLVVLLAVSCAQEAGTTTLKILLNSDVRTISADTPEITHYVVKGYLGEEEHTWSPQENHITIEGIATGTWHFTATGYNANNLPIVSGEKDVNVTAMTRSITIVLDSPVSTGAMDITFAWDADKVKQPSVKVFRRGPVMSEEETEVTGDVITSSGSCRYSKSNLTQGSYVIRAEIYDGTVKVGGLADTVIVVGGTTASGTLSLGNSGTYTPSDTGIFITNSIGATVTGNFDSSVSKMLESADDLTSDLSFILDGDIDGTSCKIEWYHDGEQIVDGADNSFTYYADSSSSSLGTYKANLTFSPQLGVHTIDAVVYSNLSCSAGSAKWVYTGVPACGVGGLQKISTVADGDTGIRTGENVLVGSLPDDRFAVLSKEKGILSICKVSENQLVYESACEYAWLKSAKGLYSDPMCNVFVVVANSGGTESFTTFLYTRTSSGSTVEKLPAGSGGYDNATYVAIDDEIVLEDVRHVEFVHGSSGAVKIFISMGDMEGYYPGIVVTNNTIDKYGYINSYIFNGYQNGPDADFYTDVSADTGRRLTVHPTAATIQVADYTPSSSSLSLTRYTATTDAAMSCASFVNYSQIFCGNSSTTYLYSEDSSHAWTKNAELAFGCTSCSVSGSKAYTFDGNETIHAISISGETMSEINSQSFENASGFALNGEYLLVSSSDGTLYLCAVKQDS